MNSPFCPPLSATGLRRELSARNMGLADAQCRACTYEQTFGNIPSVIYAADETGHGNFLAASYRRICADSAWAQRLGKAYTASARVPRSSDRRRAELECANSSDALLMNIFCYPGLLRRPQICALLGVDPGLRPEFGARARIAMRRREIDRTELDMRLGNLMVEAKLTETGFGSATRERVLRYTAVEDVFDLDELPWNHANGRLHGYQLVRGALAAEAEGTRFLLLCDQRRTDLHEMWFRVLRAVRSYDLRSRMALLSWQELAATTPPAVQTFLAAKYGIAPR